VTSCAFHPDAADELEEAGLFYESRMAGLGRSFAAEIERTLFLLTQYPSAGAADDSGCRRVPIARFPYSIVYRQQQDIILVVAVAHQRRRPGYWRRRG
jgi:hypothetical protein